MKTAKVIGFLTLSKKLPELKGARWVLLSPMSRSQLGGSGDSLLSKNVNLVAYDPLGTKLGDTVGYVEGAEASAPFDVPTPVDAYVVALFDNINLAK